MKELMNKKYIEWTFKDALKVSVAIMAIYAAVAGVCQGIYLFVQMVQEKIEERKEMKIPTE